MTWEIFFFCIIVNLKTGSVTQSYIKKKKAILSKLNHTIKKMRALMTIEGEKRKAKAKRKRKAET